MVSHFHSCDERYPKENYRCHLLSDRLRPAPAGADPCGRRSSLSTRPQNETTTPNKKENRPTKCRDRKACGQKKSIHARIADAFADTTMAIPTVYVFPGDDRKKPNRLSGKDVLEELKKTTSEIDDLIQRLNKFLDANVEKEVWPRELVEALVQLGAQVPSWVSDAPYSQGDYQAQKYTPPQNGE
jgi:hypothetical protein